MYMYVFLKTTCNWYRRNIQRKNAEKIKHLPSTRVISHTYHFRSLLTQEQLSENTTYEILSSVVASETEQPGTFHPNDPRILGPRYRPDGVSLEEDESPSVLRTTGEVHGHWSLQHARAQNRFTEKYFCMSSGKGKKWLCCKIWLFFFSNPCIL